MATIPTQETPEPTLAELVRRHRHRWYIRRAGTLWMATTKTDLPDAAPTIVETDPVLFARALEDPPARACVPYAMRTCWPAGLPGGDAPLPPTSREGTEGFASLGGAAPRPRHAEAAEAPVLAALRARYGDRWHISRSRGYWVGLDLRSTAGGAPRREVIETDLQLFVALLVDFEPVRCP